MASGKSRQQKPLKPAKPEKAEKKVEKKAEKKAPQRSPILRAIAAAENGTTGEVRVHLSRRWFEKDPFGRAQRIFEAFSMHRTSQRNAVLFYVNLRKRKFAIIGDEGVNKAVGQQYWEELARALEADLKAGPPENAIAVAVATVGVTLQKYFPAEARS